MVVTVATGEGVAKAPAIVGQVVASVRAEMATTRVTAASAVVRNGDVMTVASWQTDGRRVYALARDHARRGERVVRSTRETFATDVGLVVVTRYAITPK